MPRAFLVKKPCVSTCKRNWSELPDEERGEIYVPGEAPRAPGGRGARTSGRRRSVERGDAASRRRSTPGAEGARVGEGDSKPRLCPFSGPGAPARGALLGTQRGVSPLGRPPALAS